MKMSPEGLQALVLREGSKLKAYKDTKGIWTIGVGDIDVDNDGVRDVHAGMTETPEQVIANLQEDIQWAEEAVDDVDSPLTQNQYDALVSFVFNIGASAFAKSTMKRMLNAGDYEGAAKQFDRWHKPVEIIGRRDSEKEQFLS